MNGVNNFPRILRIIRGHIVLGGILAFSVGGLLAMVNGGAFNLVRIILAYVVVLLGDLSTHYSNDYFDVEVDKLVEQKKFFAGSNILVSHPELRSLSKHVSIMLLVSSNFLALLIVFLNMAPIEFLIVALSANIAAWFYSAPPLRLISKGFGEIVVACVTGFAIPAAGYLAVRGQFDYLFIYFGISFIMYGLILSLSLAAPDVEVDGKVGRRNLAVRMGIRRVFFLICAVAAVATLTFFVYAWKIPLTVIDARVVGLFSFAPLATAVFGLVRVFQKEKVNLFSGLNIGSLFIFNLLMIVYLLYSLLA